MRRLGEWITDHARGAVVPAKQRDIIVSHLSVGRQYSCPYPTTAPHLYTERCGVRGQYLILLLGGGLRGRSRTARAQRQLLRCVSREHHSPTEACMIHSKQHRGRRTLGPVASITLIKKNPWCTSRCQGPGTHGYRRWKRTDFSHSAGTAHCAPPTASVSTASVGCVPCL